MSEAKKSKLVHETKDKAFKVYLVTTTNQSGPKAGETFDRYHVLSTEDQFSIEIPPRWSGFDLHPEDAVELAQGHEILVERTSSKLSLDPATGVEKPKTYSQIFSPLPVKESKGDKQLFRSRNLVSGFPTFSRTNPDEMTMITTANYDAKGKEIPNSKVSSYRKIGPQEDPIKVTVADLALALQAIAKGETYEIKGPGFTVPAKGIKLPAEGSKHNPMLEWGRVQFQRQGDDEPLPSASPKKPGQARRV